MSKKSAAPENAIEFRLPMEGMEGLASHVLREAFERAGIAQAIADATTMTLALHGMLDKEGAAKFLGIKMSTLEEWMQPVSEGGRGLPYLKIGAAVRFRISSIEAWAANFEVNKVLPKVA